MRRFFVSVVVPVLSVVLAVVAFTLVRPAEASDQFLNTSPPTISGTAAVGKVLTLNPGEWTGEPDGFSVQWLRDGEDDVVSVSLQYTPVRADAGHFITALVTAERAGDQSTSTAESDRVSVDAFIAPSARTRPTMSGTVRVGKKLTARNGTWDGTGYRYSYRWLANNAPISGAVSSTYVLKAAQQGKKISVRVTASKSGFPSTASTSALSKAVAKK